MSQQDVNTKEYYDIHCLKCGEIFKANELTLNIDELLRKHSDYIKKEKNNNTDYEVFKSIKIGMNYSEDKVKELLDKRYIDTNDIRLFLSSKHIDIEVEKKDEQQETIVQPRSRRRLETIAVTTRIPEDVLIGFREVVKFRARDIDEDTKDVCYEQLYRILSKDEKLIEIKEYQIIKKEDDRGNEFIDNIIYTLHNGRRYIVNELSCPYCGAEIKGSLGEHKQFVIGMIGSARVGKTAYLASLVDRLDPEPGIKSIDDKIFVKIGESSIGKKTFVDDILSVYRRNEKIPKTPPVNGWVPVFCLEVSINDKSYIFTFVDMPGEVFVREEDDEIYSEQDQDFIINNQRIITNSHMLWFCIDPIQIDPIIQKRKKEMGRLEGDDEVVEDVGKLFYEIDQKLDFIKAANGGKKKQKAAILITKSDTIGEEFHLIERRGEDDKLTENINNESNFAIEKHIEHTKKVYRYLTETNNKLIYSFKDMFEDFNLFAVASYGIDLAQGGGARKPSNVEQPFLWTCAVLGILPGKKDVIKIEERKTGKWPFAKTEEVQIKQKVNIKPEDLFFHE